MEAGLCLDYALTTGTSTSTSSPSSSTASRQENPFLLEVVFMTERVQNIKNKTRSFAVDWMYPAKQQAQGA
eukprot:1720413-Amphidinium_carterae.1